MWGRKIRKGLKAGTPRERNKRQSSWPSLIGIALQKGVVGSESKVGKPRRGL